MENRVNSRQQIHIWRIVAAGVILLLIALYVFLPAVHRAVSGWVMALTQRSVQAFAGAVGQAGVFAPLKAAWLSAVQTLALPWLTPYSIGGNVLALGPVVGGMASFLGALFGASTWFALMRLFFGSWLSRLYEGRRSLTAWEGFSLVAALNWLTLGMLSLSGAVLGITRASYRRFILCAAISELPVVILYAVCCNPYRALLPNLIETAVRIAGGLAVAGFVASRWLCNVRKPRKADEAQTRTGR